MTEQWQSAERVQKNAAGEYRALIGGEWVPAVRAQKSTDGQYRVVLAEPDAPAEEKKGRSLGQKFARQMGLTGRYAIEGGLGLADLLATPIRVGLNAAAPGTFDGRTGGQAAADILGLPKPETTTEQMVALPATALVGAGGGIKAAEAAAGKAIPAAQRGLRWLAENPKLQAQAALGAGGGMAAADQAGAGPWGQLAAGLAGAVAVPGGFSAVRMAAEPAMDVLATIGASAGSRRGTNRLLTDAVERGVGDQKGRVHGAMRSATEYVEGAKPTAADAVAEANLKSDDVFGGWVTRVQKDVSGARGVEDVLPTAAKRHAQALDDAKAALEQSTAPLRTKALNAVNAKGGVDARRVAANLDALAADPDIAGTPALLRAVNAARRHVDSLVRPGVRGTSRIDAKTLYAARKSVNKVVAKAAEVAEGHAAAMKANQADQARQGWVARQIQQAYDDAIRDSGDAGSAKLWDAYRSEYSAGMTKIEADLARTVHADEIARGVKPLSSQIVPGEIPKPPTLLNRKMMFANWFLSKLGADANDPVVKELARALQDPAEFAKLLQRPTKDPLRMRAVEAMKRGEQMAAETFILNQQGQ